MTITVGPWPSGPVWFVWVLLTFDITASLAYRLSSHLLEPINLLRQPVDGLEDGVDSRYASSTPQKATTRTPLATPAVLPPEF